MTRRWRTRSLHGLYCIHGGDHGLKTAPGYTTTRIWIDPEREAPAPGYPPTQDYPMHT